MEWHAGHDALASTLKYALLYVTPVLVALLAGLRIFYSAPLFGFLTALTWLYGLAVFALRGRILTYDEETIDGSSVRNVPLVGTAPGIPYPVRNILRPVDVTVLALLAGVVPLVSTMTGYPPLVERPVVALFALAVVGLAMTGYVRFVVTNREDRDYIRAFHTGGPRRS